VEVVKIATTTATAALVAVVIAGPAVTDLVQPGYAQQFVKPVVIKHKPTKLELDKEAFIRSGVGLYCAAKAIETSFSHDNYSWSLGKDSKIISDRVAIITYGADVKDLTKRSTARCTVDSNYKTHFVKVK
jgi:hypothetical protein